MFSAILAIAAILAITAGVVVAASKKKNTYYRNTDEENAKIESENSANYRKYVGRGIKAGLALFVLAWLATGIVSVGAGQVGVVTRFGAVVGRELEPGVSLKAPFPVERVVIMDTRVQKTGAETAAASNDLQDVKGNIVVNWHLERGKVSSIYQQVGPNFEDKVLTPAIQESFKSTTAKYSAADLIKNRTAVAQDATKALNERVSRYGITVDSVNITNLEFSQAFTQAIEQSQVAAQQVIKAQNEVERVKAEAEAAIAEAQGKAEAQRQQAQTITPEYLELKRIEAQQQAVAKWNGQLPTTTTGDNAFFQLPVGR